MQLANHPMLASGPHEVVMGGKVSKAIIETWRALLESTEPVQNHSCVRKHERQQDGSRGCVHTPNDQHINLSGPEKRIFLDAVMHSAMHSAMRVVVNQD
jgi:hypothetical protein